MHDRTPDCNTASSAWMHLITERSFELTSYSWVFVQPGTGRRPVDWCRDIMFVLHHVRIAHTDITKCLIRLSLTTLNILRQFHQQF